KIALIEPADRLDPTRPAMRARNQPQRRIANRIDGYPKTQRLLAVDEIVWNILVPGRRLLRSRLLHEHMIVEELRRPRFHGLGGEPSCEGFAHDALEFGDALPVAIIVEEAPRLAGAHALGRQRAGLAHVAINARRDCPDP